MWQKRMSAISLPRAPDGKRCAGVEPGGALVIMQRDPARRPATAAGRWPGQRAVLGDGAPCRAVWRVGHVTAGWLLTMSLFA
jgi:hypothetical protein